MKAKLIKTTKNELGYTLLVNMENILNKDLLTKLSLKNCQAIELGYDLDELSSLSSKSLLTDVSIREKFNYIVGYQMGFQKAIEILGDKKYTEDNMMQMAGYMSGIYKIPNVDGREEAKEYLKTFEVKEWDVEIEMCVSENYVETDILKLDSEGCLILKRLNNE